jgi:hypothetical protein
MGLLDNRNHPTFKESLKKFDWLYRGVGKVLQVRNSNTVTGHPQLKGFRIYGYHLLAQQGMPGAIKVAIFASAFIVPPLLIALASGRRHNLWKDPLNR